MADISGSTALAERLAERGPTGVETLSRLLNAYFGKLIEITAAHGGDVVKFAGDGLLAMWTVSAAEAVASATVQAARCALSVQQLLHNYAASEEPILLSCRIGIAAGTVCTAEVGGVGNRWELLVGGEPVAQAAAAQKQGEPGQVVVSAAAWSLISHCTQGEALGAGSWRLSNVAAMSPPCPLVRPPVTAAMEASLRGFVPAAVLPRIIAGQTEWLSELRRVTVMFVKLPDIDVMDSALLEQLDTAFRQLQASFDRHGGSIGRLHVDDKGPVALAVFGLAPLAHEDDPARAVAAAFAIQRGLARLGLPGSIGIATGRAFCGSVGNAERHEYTVIGDVANLAARLMQTRNLAILCDEATYRAAGDAVHFDALPPLTLRGKAGPVAVYRPTHETKGSTVPQVRLIGRTVERQVLIDQLRALRHGGSGVVVIEGEAGIGKSCIVAELCAQAAAWGIPQLVGAGDAIEVATPYHAWSAVVRQLFTLDEMPDEPALRLTYVQARLEQSLAQPGETGAVKRLLPLLSAVLPVEFPENDLTAALTGQARADNTNQLLVHILNAAARATPRLLILDDAHWLDSSSWTLARLVGQRVQPALLVLVTRPLHAPLPPEQRELLESPTTRRLRLDSLSADDALVLACERLEVPRLPEPVAALLWEKAGGHPFFTEQLAYALRDAGVIVIAEHECQLAPHAPDLSQLTFLESVEGVVTSRIDRLLPRQQLLLKVASVMGRAFSLRALSDIYPIAADRPYLADDLEALHALDLTQSEPAADRGYLFKHAITHEVAYNLMAFAQRRRLHRALAEWYEQHHAGDLPSIYPLLAHHWSEAARSDFAVASNAIDYLERAAQQAVTRYANEEAIRFLTTAGEFANKLVTPGNGDCAPAVSPGRRAGWERRLGEAYFGVGKLAEARLHLEQALTWLGFRVPRRTAALALGLAVEVVRQARHRFAKRGQGASHQRGDPSPAAEQRAAEAAGAYSYLHLVFFIAMEQLPSVYAALRSLNLAESAGPSRELVNGYGAAALLTGMISQPLGERYYRRAFETAKALHEPAARMGPCFGTGYFYFRTGTWERAEAGFGEAHSIAATTGDHRFWELSGMQLGCVRFTLGGFATALARYDEAYESARRRGDVDAQALATIGRVAALVMLGRAEEALRALAALHAWLGSDLASLTDRGIRINAHGMLALALERTGDGAAARAAAERAMALIEQAPALAHYALAGYGAVAEASLRAWEAAATPVERTAAAPLARRTCRALRRFARVLPFARPQAWLWLGVAAWQHGHHRHATRLWGKSLAAATRLRLRYEEAAAHYELGRHAAAGAARRTHLIRAVELFRSCGAEYNRARAQAALDGDAPPAQIHMGSPPTTPQAPG